MLKRRPFLLLVSFGVLLSLLLLSQVLSNWSLFSRPGYASTIQSGHETPPSFTYQQYLKQAPKPKVVKSGPPSPYPQPPRQTTGGKPTTRPPDAEPPTMKALTQPLTSAFLAGSASALDLKGNDGRLEIQLQPGSLDMSHATVAGGAAPNGSLTLQVTQVHGHYEGLMNQLGYYQAQIIDSQGQVVNGIILRSPVTIIYHYQPTELAGLNLNPAHLLLDWPTLIAAAQQAKQPTTTLVIAMRDNPTARTLTALSPVFGPGPFSLFADPQNQGDPSPHVAEMQGNNGQLTYSYPLQVAPGTGGFAPQLALNYSSMDPNDRHSATSPAGDEGDGWSLGLGSITMETYPTTPTATNWYFINGVDNVSDRLIEYDTTNKLFYTEHLSYLRIQQVTTNGQSCFDVWDKSGTFYELGCTKDSLEYSVSGSTTYDYQWNVDRIVAPNQGPKASEYRMILATYLQDCSPASTSQPCPATDTVRDAVLQQITYGSATSVTASTLSSIAGTIDFTYHAPFSYTSNNVTWATAYGNNYNCASAPPDNQTTTLRCDDPIQRSGGFTPPDVMSTFSLDRITSYIGPDSGTGSYPAYAYTFSYTDTPFYGISCIDPILLTDGYCAGEHTLSSITPHIYLQGTDHARKSISFSYATSINSYYDSLDQVRSGNPPTYFQNSTLWNYLTSYFDLNTGIGESISYETAYSNTDGTPTIKVNGSVADDRFDALYCTSNAGNSNQSLQCFQGSWLHPNDQAWSVQVVTSITSSGKDDSALSQATTTYAYYRLADTGTYSGSGAWCYPDQYTQENQCVGDNWFASFDGDWGDYYHAEFRGFAQVSVKTPAGDLVNSYYFSTEGWDKSPTDPGDYDAGQVQVQEIYQGGSQNAANLLSETVNTYPGPYAQNGDSKKNPNNDATACYTPNGPSSYAACDVVILSSATTDYEGQSSGPSVTTSYTYDDYTPSGGLTTCKVRITFCAYHNLFQKQVSTSNSNVPTVTDTWSYSPNDQNAGGWTYYTVDAATHSETDSGGHIYQCQDITYDEGGPSGLTVPVAGWPTTVSTYSNANCVTPRGAAISTTYTGYDAYGNPVATVDGVATAPGNSSIYSTNGCTLSTNPYVMSAAWTTNYSRYTSCVTYDSPYNAQPATTANAFGQSETTTFDYTQAALPTQVKDANSQQTSTSYSIDGNGNETVQTQLPLHSSSYTTESITNSNCASGDTLPCYEVDTISNQYHTVTARTFYDSQGRAVETRTPGPTSGYDTVVFTTYDDVGHSMFQSLPFVVSDGSSFIDPATVNPGGTATFYDALGRVLATKDPNLGQTQQPDPEPGQNCPAPLSATATDCTTYSLGTVSDSNDSNTYLIVTAIDPNGHATVNALDPLGRTAYVQFDSGTFSGTFSLNELKAITYNFLNEPTAITVTDEKTQSGQNITSVTNTTASYDDLGRLTGITDPDRGTHAYTYDADGQMLTDVSGTRTIGYVYDLLGRVGCVQNMTPTESATGACSSGATQYVKNTYDTSNLGTQGTNDFPVGLLTKSVATTRYPDNSNAQVSETYQHDQRGRLVAEQISFPNLPSAWNVTTSLPKYKVQYTYNDADQLTTTTTTTNPVGQGYTTTQVYDPTTGTQTGLSDNGTNTPDLATLSFNTQAQISSLNYLTSGGGSALATDQFSYDGDLRPITDTANWQSGSGNGTAAIFSQSRSFDPAGNLTSLTTTQAGIPNLNGSGGTETSNFCYDEQNRLVWAGNSGKQPLPGNGTCGSGALSSGLTGASYSNTYVYTHLGQLYQAPLNGSGTQEQYLYCGSNTSDPHQLTGLYPTSSGATCANYTQKTADYSSSYDAFGNVTSRTTGGTTATLSYDLLDHLTKWYVSATNQEQYIYDASGNRILRRSTTSSGTTMTVYAFGLEDHTYSGSGTNQGNTYYYSLAGRLIGSNDANGTVFYMTDTLGSILASFTNTAGGAALKGNQVFGPYGNARYSAGTINTAKGFTGQYNDALTGLDYYNARYYDPVAGVFLSADVKQGDMQGVNPYAYVNGNPETDTDPTGYYMGTSIPFSQQGGAIGYIAPGSDILYSEVNNGNYFGSITGVSGQNTPTSSNIDVHTQTLQAAADPYNPLTDANNSPLAKLSQAIGLPALQQVWGDPNATWQDKFGAFFHFLGTNANNVFQFAMIFGGGPEGDAEEVVAEEASTLARDLAPREQYVLDNLDSLIPDHGGEGDNILFGDKVPSYNGSRPDIVTPKAIVEVTGEGPNGLPADLAPGLRKANQLTNFVKGANPGQSVYLAYDGDVSQFSEALNNFLEKWGIIVVPFNLP